MTFQLPSTNKVPLLQSIVRSAEVEVICVSPSPRACASGAATTAKIEHAATARQAAVRVIVAPFAHPDRQSVRGSDSATVAVGSFRARSHGQTTLGTVSRVDRRAVAVAVMIVTTLMTVIGCSHTVSGTARRIAQDDAPSQ